MKALSDLPRKRLCASRRCCGPTTNKAQYLGSTLRAGAGLRWQPGSVTIGAGATPSMSPAQHCQIVLLRLRARHLSIFERICNLRTSGSNYALPATQHLGGATSTFCRRCAVTTFCLSCAQKSACWGACALAVMWFACSVMCFLCSLTTMYF